MEEIGNKPIEKDENKKYKIFYSQYGYIKILEEELQNNTKEHYNFIQSKHFNNNNHNLHGTIYKNNFKDKINFKVKYFFSDRKLVPFENIDIHSNLGIIMESLFSKTNITNVTDVIKKFSKNTQHRLYSCKSGLRELNNSQSFYENNIMDNEILIYFDEKRLSFSSLMKGKSIELSQVNCTALKIATDNPQYIMGNYGYKYGCHYFEIKLLTDPMIRSIVVGLSVKNDENNLSTTDIKKFYGYILSDIKSTIIDFSQEEQEKLDDYGAMCIINDRIGVLFNCKDDGVDISFYKNGKNLGIAFNKLPNNVTYYPTVEMGLCGSKIQINNDLEYPQS